MADGFTQTIDRSRDLIAGLGQGAQALGALRESGRMSRSITRAYDEAAAYEQQANLTELNKIRRQSRAVQGAALARAGASGVDTGSFSDVMTDSVQQGLLDEALQNYSSMYRQRQIRAEGAARASQARFEGMKQVDEYSSRAKDSLTRWWDGRAKPAPGSSGDPISWNNDIKWNGPRVKGY